MVTRHTDISVDGIRADSRLIYESGKMYENKEATKQKSVEAVRPSEMAFNGLDILGFKIPPSGLVIIAAFLLFLFVFNRSR